MRFNRYMLGGALWALGTDVVAALLLRLFTVIVHSYWPSVPVIPFWHAVGVLLVGTVALLVWFKGLMTAAKFAAFD